MRTSLSAIAFAGAGVLALPGYAAAEQPINLDRIVISAGKEKVAIDTPQSVSVVDQEDMDEEQPVTLGDALTDLPGVKAVGSDRVLGESFNIRGIGTFAASDESKLIIQVDGATKFYEQYRMGSFFSDPELYKRVEILRGPASSTLYGAGALAGVINVTTKDAADYLSGGDKMAFRQKIAGNSNGSGFLTSSIVAARPTDQLDLLGAFVYRRSDEFEDGAGKEIRGSDFKAPSWLLKGSYSFGADREHKLKASYQHWTTEDKGAEYSQTGTLGFGKVDREVTDETVVLGYSYLPDNMLIDLNATFSYSDTKVVQNNAQFKGGRSALFNDTKYGYATWQGRVENTSSFTGEDWKNYLTVGIGTERQTRTADQEKLSNNRNSGGIGFHPGGQTLKIGVYAQNELILWDKLTLIPGLRIDRQTVKPGSSVTAADRKTATGTAVSPKLAMFYEIDRNFGVFGSVARTERLPVLDELYDARSGNLKLKAEKSLNYEVGLSASFENAVLDQDRLASKLTLFRNDIKNLIERESTRKPYFNRGESEIKGIELEASYESTYLFARAAYTMIRGKDSATGQNLNSIPADELVLNIGGRVPSHNVTLGWRGVFAKEQKRVSGRTKPSDGYAVHDVYASWIPKEAGVKSLKAFEVRAGVDNVFNRDYKEHLAGDRGKGRTYKLSVVAQF